MYWYQLLFLWTQCYVVITVLNVCTSIWWIIFPHSYLLRLRLRLRQCLFNQNRYRNHIRFTKNITIYNNHIFLIYNESDARWETSIKVISDRWHGGHPKRNSMHTQWEKYITQLSDDGVRPTATTAGPSLRHPNYRRDSRTHLRAGHPQVKYTGARSANES